MVRYGQGGLVVVRALAQERTWLGTFDVFSVGRASTTCSVKGSDSVGHLTTKVRL